MYFFYSNLIVDNPNDLSKIIILDKFESNHCLNVLRYKEKDKIKVVDGYGNLYEGKIGEIKKNQCFINVYNIFENYMKRDYYVHIAIAPTKNHDRLEWFVEKAIELGIDEISFIKCSRSLRTKIRMNRIQKVAITAMKQTLKAYIPKINDIISFNDFLKLHQNNFGYICHLEEDNKKSLLDYRNRFNVESSYVLIGPEGDFSQEEIECAVDNNVSSISLGDNRLRTETAGVAVCHLINLINV